MKPLKILAALFAAIALSACSSTTGDQAGADGAGANGAGASGAATAGTAGALDPSTVEYFRSEIGDRVYFATDSSSLDPEAQDILRRQAAWLMENSARAATIEGHADERGTREYNLALGARRASAVRNFLVEEGVPSDRLRTVTYGKERPEALCSEESCWRLNRRAVTVMADAPVS
ncbi:MAG: peptidoglycan-associated lipoprotein Pal [Pseudomonadota bacterium]